MVKKDVIIGMIAHYDFDVLYPFISTLKKSGYTGDVVFFHADVDTKTLRRLDEEGVILVPFRATYPYLENLSLEPKFANNPRIRDLAVYCLRYLLAYIYLGQHPEYEQVLLTDTRDVIFQKDPFDFPISESLCCFEERKGFTIGDSEMNASWIREAFGKESAMKFAQKPVICSGVTFGSCDRIMHYLRIFLETIVAYDIPTDRRGMDQGIHNFLLYTDAVPGVKIFHNDGPVLTLGVEDTVRYDAKKHQILHSDGTIPNIVHQYDRHPAVARHYWRFHFLLRQKYSHLRGLVATSMSNKFPRMYARSRRLLGRLK